MTDKTLYPTCWAEIHVGLAIRDTGEVQDINLARKLVSEFCNLNKVGVSFTPTEYIYPGGSEAGFVVGLINYPRFPKEDWEVYKLARDMSIFLTEKLKQYKVTMVTSEAITTFFHEPFGHEDPMK